jgi:hypothetical protein
MFELTRYRGLATVGAGILVAMGVADISLTLMLGFIGRWLPHGEYPTPSEVFARTGELIAGVMQAPEKVGIGTDIQLGVLLGQSGLGAAADTKVLTERHGAPIRWLNLHGWGSSIHGIHDVYDLIRIGGLKPNIVVLAINPFMLVGDTIHDSHPYLIKKQGKRLKPWVWIYNNRRLLNDGVRIALHHLKLELCQTFGFGLSALYPPYPDPWHRPSGPRRADQESAEERAERLEYDEHLGWFDATRYSPESSNSRALVEIVREARRAGAKVCIILLPEHSAFRDRIPPEAVSCFAEINRINFAEDPVPVYNLRKRLSDEQFSDLQHVSVRAMEQISIVIANCVRDCLSGHSAPESFRATGVATTASSSRTP